MYRRAIRFAFRVDYLHVSDNERAAFRVVFRSVNMFSVFDHRFITILGLRVSPITFIPPRVIFCQGTSSAMFARRVRAFQVRRRRVKDQVIVRVRSVATEAVITTTYQIRRAKEVMDLYPFDHFFHFGLSPYFIREGPGSCKEVKCTGIRSLFPFAVVINLKFEYAFVIFSAIVRVIVPSMETVVTTQRVLPCRSAFLVTVVVPTYQFRFRILASRVRTPVFYFLSIRRRYFVYQDHVGSIEPPSLIRQTRLRWVLVVRLRTRGTNDVTFEEGLARDHV